MAASAALAWPAGRRARPVGCSSAIMAMPARSSGKADARVLASRFSERMMRRPPESNMPRQFLKLSVISRQVGMVVMVLSQFCTLTVLESAMSVTKAVGAYLGISIQSPTRSMSLLPSWNAGDKGEDGVA